MLSTRTAQHTLVAAKATGGRRYLDLPFEWTPARQFDHGQVYEYRLALGEDDVAILQLVADKGWVMTITHGGSQPDTARGLFATPHDALMVLGAEFVAGTVGASALGETA